MISRRKLLFAIGAGTLPLPGRVFGQAAGRTYRLGWLSTSNMFYDEPHYVAFVQRLSELGFVEGRNLSIARRQCDNRLEKLPPLAAELAQLKCDIFFGGGTQAVLAALTHSSRDIPVVFIAVDFDPVATGDVASLARPGGRVTGITALQSTMPAKRLELLKEMLPNAAKVAVFTNAETTEQLSVVRDTAGRMGLPLRIIDFKRPPFDYEAGFADATRARADALFVLGSGLWVPARGRITELALKSRLPTVFHQFDWVNAGGLMSYGFSFPSMWRRGAEMVAGILRGARISEIPMEQPTTFELAISLRTAKSLGIKIPNSILLRADKVIE